MEIALNANRINKVSRNVTVPELFQKMPPFIHGIIFIAVYELGILFLKLV